VPRFESMVRCAFAPRNIPLTIGVAAVAEYAVQLETRAGGPAVTSFNNRWTYNLIFAISALACVVSAWRRADRIAWFWIALGVALWGAGDCYYTFVLEQRASIPFPSLADAGYLGFYVPVYIGVGVLVRSQVAGFVRSLWLDGLIAGLTAAALGAGLVLELVLRSIGPHPGLHAAVATNLAYPLGDTLLLAIVVGVASLSGWRLSSTWLFVAAGLLLFAIADSVYLVRVATDTYTVGTLLDAGWPLSAMLIAAAAAAKPRAVRAASLEGRRLLVVPALFASIDLAIVVVDHWVRLNLVASSLAALALAFVIARMWLTFGEYLRVLRSTREEAMTDALTGLGNRRALVRDLEEAAAGGEPSILMLFDLNGFKVYNDRFGHPAGDALLARLGADFRRAVESRGSAYRLGGDEFCAIVRGEAAEIDRLRVAAASSLSASGEGFEVSPSAGAVAIPGETRDATEALRLVDRRMYQDKESSRAPGTEGAGVLVGVMQARDPQLAAHTGLVAELTLAIGRELDGGATSPSLLRTVAVLHDIGKVAIPDAILDKPGPLTEEEWALVRQHSLIGERIVNGAPGLERVGEAIRATHERWDGSGYPDGLRGEAIPLVARIVAVADAFEAMTSGDRPYRTPRPYADAVAEILACAGTQFDPEVVRAFVRALGARRGQLPLAAGA
jgi:two-component system cell cycle response regulator